MAAKNLNKSVDLPISEEDLFTTYKAAKKLAMEGYKYAETKDGMELFRQDPRVLLDSVTVGIKLLQYVNGQGIDNMYCNQQIDELRMMSAEFSDIVKATKEKKKKEKKTKVAKVTTEKNKKENKSDEE